MKIKQKSNKKKIILIVALIAVIVGGYTAVAFTTNMWPFREKETQIDTTTNDTPSPKPQGSANNTDDASDDENKKTPYEEEPKEQTPNSTLSLTNLKQADGAVTVNAVASNAQNGRCIAYFTADVEGYSISEYMKVTNKNNQVECSVSINELKFTYLGTWNVRIVYTTPQNTKTETTGTITIQ